MTTVAPPLLGRSSRVGQILHLRMEVVVRLDPLRIALDLAVVAVVLGGFVLDRLERLVHGDLTQLDDL